MAGKHKPKGMELLRAAVPQATYQWFADKAEREGVSIQSLVAPILNAVARNEIRGGYSVGAADHGNAGRRKLKNAA